MKEININNFKETLFYEKLPNGLEIFLIPMKNKKKYHLSISVKYGNYHTNFKVNNKNIVVPSGIAHFLEHKMFERNDMETPFKFFAKSGTDVNAATSIFYTQYYCSGNNMVNDNLKYLLNWITKLSINNDTVEKEKGIILQEERMCFDNPDRLLYEKSKQNTFIKDPYKNPVIGTQEEIKSMTMEDIITCYNSFYRPDNMFVIAVGDFDKDEAIKIIKEELKDFKNPKDKIKINKIKEPKEVKKEYEEIMMDISSYRIWTNYKILKKDFDISNYELNLYLSLILRIIFGSTSKFNEECLKNNLFSDFDFLLEESMDYLILSIYIMTDKPEEILKEVNNQLNEIKINEDDFERLKKVYIANEIKNFDYVDYVASDVFNSIILYDEYKNNTIEDIENLSYKKMLEIISKLNLDNKTVFKIIPKNNNSSK